MYCTKCGAKISDNAIFCTRCGEKVKEKNINKQIEDQVKNDEQTSDKTELLFEQEVPGKEIFSDDIFSDIRDDEAFQSDGEPKNLLIILAGILGFVAVCVIVILICVLFMNRKEKMSEDIVNIEETSEESLSENEMAASEEEEIQKMLEEGKKMLLSGDNAGALEKCEEIKEVNSKCEDVYLLGADIYLKQDDYGAALTILEEGYNETQSTYLAERKEYICKNIVISEVKAEGSNSGFTYAYDAFGNLVKEDLFNEWYEFTGWKETDYNSAGNRIRCDIYDSNGTLVKSSSYGYDKNGYLVSQVDYSETGSAVGQHRYVYDSEGYQIECNDFNENGKNIWNTKSEYDSQGRKITDSGYNEKGKLMGWVETKYNANGNVSQMIRYDKDGKIQEWNETEYNANGDVSKFFVYTGERELSYWTETEYDTDGNKDTTVRYSSDGSVFSYCEYDNAGKKVKERNENMGVTYIYSYHYIGDILCESDIEPASGQLSISQMTGYRRNANDEATFVGMAKKGTVYFVIGETDGFYLVEQGWYFSKTQEGIQFTKGQ